MQKKQDSEETVLWVSIKKLCKRPSPRLPFSLVPSSLGKKIIKLYTNIDCTEKTVAVHFEK